MKEQTPLSTEELKKMRPQIKNTNQAHKESLSSLERVALCITDHVGTMGFFIIIFIWTSTWLTWNAFGPTPLRFDPFPAFVLWLFISNMIQIFLMPLIMIGQNLEGRHSEKRADMDFEVNVRAERETETILLHLENQNKILNEINDRLGQKTKSN